MVGVKLLSIKDATPHRINAYFDRKPFLFTTIPPIFHHEYERSSVGGNTVL